MSIVFIDLEVNQKNEVKDYGAYVTRNISFHGNQKKFAKFIRGYEYVCGHNILTHDLNYIINEIKAANIKKSIDTLPLSALLFAEKPYHHMVKDYKISDDKANSPEIDASLSHTLFHQEVEAFNKLEDSIKEIYYGLLKYEVDFSAFFEYINYQRNTPHLSQLIKNTYKDLICENADVDTLINTYPVELAYCLAIIKGKNETSIAPKWIVHTYKNYYFVMDKLRGISCHHCNYCTTHLEANIALKQYFGFDKYRVFEGVNLQEEVVNAQINGFSVIGVFPTAGGKSLAFQIPALMLGKAVKGLTVVISPLQSLMNDQVKNLKDKNINNVGTINGALNSLERRNIIDRVYKGDINLLYIAPESLRQPSTEKILSNRNIVRFVIDEAHCFSTWGHDFRVDYQYIGEFIRNISKKSVKNEMIPVSCFTATAKKEVIKDIKVYFKEQLDIDMKIFKTNTKRENLSFYVKACEGHEKKMALIKELLEESEDKPVIIYTSRRKAAETVAQELQNNGFLATVYHGGMKIDIKNSNQVAFSEGNKSIIVATSAFGMGVDKKDVAYVIHYQVSSTIEDYIQEAGRGGRDASINAKCYILYDEKDIEGHFNLLTQTKLSQTDVSKIWSTIKRETKYRNHITISAKELGRRSGWEEDENTSIKVIHSILALEKVNYVKRRQNSPKIYASSLKPKTMIEARKRIDKIPDLSKSDLNNIVRIATTLFTDKSTSYSRGTKPISMIDDLYDILDLEKQELIRLVNILKDYKVLELENDLLVHVPEKYTKKKSEKKIENYIRILSLFINYISIEDVDYNLKELNSYFESQGIESSVKMIRVVINFLDDYKIINHYKNKYNSNHHHLQLKSTLDEVNSMVDKLGDLSSFIIDYSYKMYDGKDDKKEITYSIVELKNAFNAKDSLLKSNASLNDTEKALLFVHRIGSLIIDGGFLVIYNPMRIERIEENTLKKYTKEDYQMFKDFYDQKIKKIHILTHFVKSLATGMEKGLSLVDDYFNLDYKDFEKKYITNDYKKYYDKAMTSTQYEKMFKKLSIKQKEIINDNSGKNIVVLAGPGSGKTTLLVHKLASLVELEDVKLNELLMLTFSRSATVVFKEKLIDLIGARANYIHIKTFHSYCFDIIGQVGSLDKISDLFVNAITKIENNDVDESILNISTLVIDEAQDMSENEYQLIQAIIKHNEKLRVIAVGDDDQNIYSFRGSDSKYLKLLSENEATTYELLTNFRSKSNLVEFTQNFALKIGQRYKEGLNESYTSDEGNILIYKYKTDIFYDPIVKLIKTMRSTDTTGLLTYKNQDAELLVGLLLKEGINARLIQTNMKFNLNLLYEMDFFINLFDKDNPFVTDEVWTTAKDLFVKKFREHPLIDNLLELLRQYEVLYPNKKYRTDIQEHIEQSKLEDLYKLEKNTILVSTIHKAKGREFGNVFIMLNDDVKKDEELRQVYVGLTRAKENIVIFTNQDIFDDISCHNLQIINQEGIFSKPEEIVVQLEHTDVFLDYNINKQRIINRINTSTVLDIEDSWCLFENKKVLKFSQQMQETIKSKEELGYVPFKAIVNFKVKWFKEERDSFYWILLPRLYFKKVHDEVLDITSI